MEPLKEASLAHQNLLNLAYPPAPKSAEPSLPRPVSPEKSHAPASLEDRVKVVGNHFYNASVKAKEIYQLMETVAPFSSDNVGAELVNALTLAMNPTNFERFSEKLMGFKKSYFKDKKPDEVIGNLLKEITAESMEKTGKEIEKEIDASIHTEEFKKQVRQIELCDEFMLCLEEILKERVPNGEVMHLKLAQYHQQIIHQNKALMEFLDKSIFGKLIPNAMGLIAKSYGPLKNNKSNLSIYDAESVAKDAQCGDEKEVSPSDAAANKEAIELNDAYLTLLVKMKNFTVASDEVALSNLIGDFAKKVEVYSLHKMAKNTKFHEMLKGLDLQCSEKFLELYNVLAANVDSDSDGESDGADRSSVFMFPNIAALLRNQPGLLPAEEVEGDSTIMGPPMDAMVKDASKANDPMDKEAPKNDS